MTIISQENLLGYVKGNKLWHDNSQKSNTFLSYYMGNWYWHEYRQPPTPPTPTTITVSFDNSSPYLAESIPSITLSSEDTNTLMTTSSSGTDSELSIYVNWTKQYTVIPNFVDEFCFVARWEDDESNIFLPGVEYPIASDLLAVPIVARQVIHRDTQWPCPDGFHIGTKDEWWALKDAMTRLWLWNKTEFMDCLKAPSAYYLNRSNGAKNTSYWPVRFWSSTMTANNVAWCVWIDEKDAVIYQEDKPGNAFSIRPFKDTAVDPFDWTWPDPDEPGIWWTTIFRFDGSYDWIYWNQTKWIITIRSSGYLYTISDKNLWAINVWDSWTYYQFWNNYWFSPSPTPYVTSKPTLTSVYGPGNYYNNSTYVRVSSGNNWFNWTVNNIWWWVTNGTWTDPV